MNFYLIGIDHKKTPVDIREAVYWKRADITGFLAAHGTGQTAIFFTCNRFEIYGITEDVFKAGVMVDLLRNRFSPLFDNAYIMYHKNDVLRHLARLAAGLESQIKGESQIYSQVGTWAGQDGFPAELAGLAHDALLSAHNIRIKNDLSKPENNIAVLVYDRILRGVQPSRLLNIIVVGTGKIAELFASYKPQGVRIHFAAHKNILRARLLAQKAEGGALLLKELPGALLKADCLISATSSPHRVFDKNYFLKVAALRKKELYIYDLAVPRDVAPEAGDIEGIILKNIDEVVLDANVKDRHKAEQISR